ncbi:DNA transformation protein [Flavobacterium gillisiae]|uniref:DNA transformation protein n=1 Tax=Flavobacterium gillisiae TaxID=150146 RepID=A0A1H4BUT1_9FLAO|nr:TfoX/Sxy family protein [Flavobacterium gillisiae]SEA51850.1 DNA transformation protein [Flavobacterium gillisiae]
MAASTDYLDFILDQLSNWKTVHTKRMFGCVGLYADELIFGIVSKEALYFKVDDTNKEHYLAAGSETLKLFKNNSVVASFYEVPIEILENSSQIILWAEASLQIQKNKIK